MGIKNLFRLVAESAPGAVRYMTAEELNGWRVGIDASIAIYQWCSVGRSRKIVNAEGKFINHIQGCFFRTAALITAGIEPMYVFDGPPPKIKDKVLKQRRESGVASLYVNSPIFLEVRKLLDLMGVTTLMAPSEAEAQAAYLTNNGSIDAVATQDMDALAFNCRYMIRGLDSSTKGFVVIETSKVLAGLGLTRDQFIDLCILLGCDYTGTLPKIGRKKALLLIKRYGSIEAILAGENIAPSADFDYLAARAEFRNPIVRREKIGTSLRPMTARSMGILREFLITVHGLSHNRVDKTLRKLAEFYGIKQ